MKRVSYHINFVFISLVKYMLLTNIKLMLGLATFQMKWTEIYSYVGNVTCKTNIENFANDFGLYSFFL